MGIWFVAFLSILPNLTDHPGREVGFWESACEKGLGRACVDKVRLYAVKCDQGVGAACVNHGRALELGEGVPQDTQQALNAYRKGCQHHFAPSCISVHRLCSDSADLCAPGDRTRSLEHACTGGSIKVANF